MNRIKIIEDNKIEVKIKLGRWGRKEIMESENDQCACRNVPK